MENKVLKPKIRFKGFTDTWEQRKLVEIANIIMGQSPDGINYTDNPTDNILIQGNADLDNGMVVPRIWTTQITKISKPNDIIFTVRAPVGEVAKNTYNAVIGRGVASISGNNFLYQALKKMKEFDYWSKLSAGSTFDSINSEQLKNSEINIPLNEEQKQIGNFLEKIDNLITLHQSKYDKLVNVKKALLEKMFPKDGKNVPEIRFKGFTDTWEQRKLDDIVDRYDNLRIPVAANLRIKGNTPYYGANGIQDYVKGYTHKGEFILVAEDGANDLKNYPVQYVNGYIWANNHVHVLQAKKEKANNKFIKYAISQTNIESLLVGGGRAKLNANIMMEIELKMPDNLQEQSSIGNIISKIDNLITLHQHKLEKLKNMKKSLLNKMFI